MTFKKIKIKKCSLNLGELHSLRDYEHINPVFEFEDSDGSIITASMRLHISEQLDGLVFADPRRFADEGFAVNSVGSKVIARKESFRDSLNDNVILDKKILEGIEIFQLDAQSIVTALLGEYNFEIELKNYLDDKNKKSEIAFTCHDPNIIGGGNVILFRLINWLNDLGVKVTVYSCGTPPTWKRVNAVFKCFKSYKEMFDNIEERIVVVYSMWHIEPVMKSNPKGKLVYHIRQIYEPYHYGSDYETMISHKYAIELLESLPIGLITISPHLEEYYRKYHNLESHLITNGIDPTVFYPTKKPKKNSNEYSIISVGNPDHFVKGTRELAKALKILALRRKDLKIKWNILTGSRGRIEIENQPNNLTIDQITGQDQLQMRKHYSDADIFVNPSLYEGFGLPTIEAMFCGTPVVQADNLGLDYIVEGKDDCIIVPVNDENKMADAIEKLIDDKNLYNKLRTGGYNKAYQHTTRHQFEMFIKEFEAIFGFEFDKEKIETINNNFGYDHKSYPSLDSVFSGKIKYNPLISVVIPSYNQAEYLREALESLIAQTYTNWEAVVVNDGSKDHTEEVMKEYAKKDSRVRPFSKPNGGITSALNAGLEHAQGEFFCWLSSDDLFYPTKLELQVKAYESLDESYAIVYGSFDILNESNTTREIQRQPFAHTLISGCEFPEALKFDFIDGCTIMIRMSVMREVKGFNPGIVHSQDMELWIRIASRGYRFHLLQNKLTIRRVHTAQSSTLNMIHCRYDAAWMINFYLEHYHLLDMYRYVNINSEKGIKDFVEHFVSRTFDSEANVNHPLLMEKYWNWFKEGLKALPVHIQNVLLRNCLIFFIKNQNITYKINYYIEKCIEELQKERVHIPRVSDYSPQDRDFRESDRSKDSFANELFEYGLNLLVNSNTPLFAQELYFHNTNKLVDTPYKLAHSAFRYLSQFNNPYREIVKPFVGFENIPNNENDALELFIKLAFATTLAKASNPKETDNNFDFISEFGKLISSLSDNEKIYLKKICSKHPTVPVLYYWNAVLLKNENKTYEALEEAWNIFGYNLVLLPGDIYEEMFLWAKEIDDIEKAYYLSVIYSKYNPVSNIASQKENLLKQFSLNSGLLPELNPIYKEKSNSDKSKLSIKKFEIVPKLDGNFLIDGECTTSENKVLKVTGTLPYEPLLKPIIVNDNETAKEYLITQQQIFDFWKSGYKFYDSFEQQLSNRILNNSQTSVAFISPYTESVNGGTLVAFRMANWLHQLGVKVLVYSTGKAPDWFDLKCSFVSIKEKKKLYDSIKEDVVITHSVLEIPDVLLHCGWSKRIYHLAQVIEDFHYHGADFKSCTMPKGIFEMLHSLPVGRISVSKHINDYLNKHYKQKSYLIENGIDIQNFKPGYKKQLSNEITITTVGNLHRILKGVDDVIDAVEMISQQHPEYKFNLIVVSNGKSRINHRLNYKSYSFNLTVLNDLSQSEMRDVYTRSDFYINGSWYEGFGLPTIEAMACGVLVLQADNKGLDGVVEDGKNCVLFQPANPKDLCEKINSVLNNSERNNSIVEEGFKTAEKYSLVNHFDNFVKAFEKILIHKFNGEKVKNLRQIITNGDINKKFFIAKDILNPKISVIIPLHKNDVGFDKTIQSLESQIYDNWEACVVYNEINEADYCILKSISKLNPRIKYAKSHTTNYADILNTGLKNITGDWLSILHPGFIYSPKRFTSMINNMELNPGKKIFYSEYYYKHKNNDTYEIEIESLKTIPTESYYLPVLMSNNFINPNTLLVNTKLVCDAGGFQSKHDSAAVYGLLLNLIKFEKPEFVLDNSCAVIDRKFLKDNILPNNVNKLLVEFIENNSFEELFNGFKQNDEIEVKMLIKNVLSFTRSGSSLLREKTVNEIFVNKISKWIAKLTNKVLSQVLIKMVENRDELDFNNWDMFLNINLDLIKKLSSSQSNKVKKSTPTTLTNSLLESGEPTVSIILVTFNQIKYTLECIESIRQFTKTPYEIIIVDNSSKDNTCMTLRNRDDIKLIENKINLGFPTAVNQAIKTVQGKNILLLNNDVVLTEGWLERMLELAKSNPVIGIVGPISNIVSGVQLDKNAKYNSIEEMHKYAGKIKKENKGQFFEFPRVAFLCTLIKREVINKIGGLDERFSPGNFEDDDFCLRAQLAGYKTVVAQDVFIHHYGSKSFKANGVEEYAKRLEHNKQVFINKWGADPEEIWLRGKTFPKRNPLIPIDVNPFAENMKRAMIYLNEKDFEQALIYLNEAIENFDRCSRIGYEQLELTDILNLAGNTAFMNQDFELAQQYFEKELQQNPTSSRACAGLAEVFYAAEMFEESKTMYEWSLKHDESNVNAKNGLKKVNGVLQLEEEHNSLED